MGLEKSVTRFFVACFQIFQNQKGLSWTSGTHAIGVDVCIINPFDRHRKQLFLSSVNTCTTICDYCKFESACMCSRLAVTRLQRKHYICRAMDFGELLQCGWWICCVVGGCAGFTNRKRRLASRNCRIEKQQWHTAASIGWTDRASHKTTANMCRPRSWSSAHQGTGKRGAGKRRRHRKLSSAIIHGHYGDQNPHGEAWIRRASQCSVA